MSNIALTKRPLALEAATPEALRPFGTLLGPGRQDAALASNFYVGHVRMSRPVEFVCGPPVDLQLATLARRPGEVRYLERHFQHTQTFIPLGGKGFAMVLAPASEGELPEIDAARAFLFDGGAGFALHLGVWHEFPFALEDQTDLVVVLSSQTGYDLATKDPQTQEAFGPDLDKKDLVARTGVMLTVDLPVPPRGRSD